MVKIRITVRIQESEIRNPDSLDYRKSYQRILMKFCGELGCGLNTNWLHFGDDPCHYPDPGVRSGTRSGSGKNCHNSIMLAFGGGLCSLSTSSYSLFSEYLCRYMSMWLFLKSLLFDYICISFSVAFFSGYLHRSIFTIRTTRVVLFSVVSVCLFVCLSVCLSVNTISPESLEIFITKFSGNHPVVEMWINSWVI